MWNSTKFFEFRKLTIRHLSFKNDLEEKFQDDYFNSSIVLMRTSFLLGAIFYALFTILDWLVLADQFKTFAFIRFGLVIPIVLIILLLSYTKNFKDWWQLGGAIATVVSGLGIICMTTFPDPITNSFYYPGMILVLIHCYILIRLRFRYATICGWIIELSYILSTIMLNKPEQLVFTVNLFFLTSANVLGMFGGYVLEFFTRKDFYYRSLFIQEQKKVLSAKNKLEDLVEEKTSELKNQVSEHKQTLKDVIATFTSIVGSRDEYTAGHQSRVADLSAAIASQMGLPREKIETIHTAGMVHDMGKIQIPIEILTKPGKLNHLEFELIKTHPGSGYKLLKNIRFSQPIAEIVLQHHERLDGSGYPRRLRSNEILLESKILAVADIVEAMASHRPYRPALGIDTALNQIKQERGNSLDPDVVDACIEIFENGYSFPEKLERME